MISPNGGYTPDENGAYIGAMPREVTVAAATPLPPLHEAVGDDWANDDLPSSDVLNRICEVGQHLVDTKSYGEGCSPVVELLKEAALARADNAALDKLRLKVQALEGDVATARSTHGTRQRKQTSYDYGQVVSCLNCYAGAAARCWLWGVQVSVYMQHAPGYSSHSQISNANERGEALHWLPTVCCTSSRFYASGCLTHTTPQG
jgi:hypothetical protein